MLNSQFDAHNWSLNGEFEVLDSFFSSFFLFFFSLSRKCCISSLFRYCLLYMNVCFSMHFLSLGFFGYRPMTSLVPIFRFLHAVPFFAVFKSPLPLVFSCPWTLVFPFNISRSLQFQSFGFSIQLLSLDSAAVSRFLDSDFSIQLLSLDFSKQLRSLAFSFNWDSHFFFPSIPTIILMKILAI